MEFSFSKLISLNLAIFFLIACNQKKSNPIMKEGDRNEIDSTSGIVQVGIQSSNFADDYKLAAEFTSENRFSEAINIYKNLTLKEGKDLKTYAYLGLGSAYSMAHDYENSIRSYKVSISLNPKNYYSLVGLGSAYLEIPDIDNSIKYYEFARDLRPNDPEAYWGLALSYDKIDNSIKAKQNAKKFIDLKPTSNYVPYMERILKK